MPNEAILLYVSLYKFGFMRTLNMGNTSNNFRWVEVNLPSRLKIPMAVSTPEIHNISPTGVGGII